MARGLDGIDSGHIETTVECIIQAEQIFVYGVGRSGIVGRAFAMRLVQLGLRVYFIGETITPIVTDKDVLVVVSNLGQTSSAIQTANIVRRVGAQVIVVTSKQHSKLSHTATHLICIGCGNGNNNTEPELAPLGTLFENSALILFDSIISKIMKKTGQTEKDMRARHAILV